MSRKKMRQNERVAKKEELLHRTLSVVMSSVLSISALGIFATTQVKAEENMLLSAEQIPSDITEIYSQDPRPENGGEALPPTMEGIPDVFTHGIEGFYETYLAPGHEVQRALYCNMMENSPGLGGLSCEQFDAAVNPETGKIDQSKIVWAVNAINVDPGLSDDVIRQQAKDLQIGIYRSNGKSQEEIDAYIQKLDGLELPVFRLEGRAFANSTKPENAEEGETANWISDVRRNRIFIVNSFVTPGDPNVYSLASQNIGISTLCGNLVDGLIRYKEPVNIKYRIRKVPGKTPKPEPKPKKTPDPTPTPTVTKQPTPTPTPSKTSTPVPTPTKTPVPTPTKTPTPDKTPECETPGWKPGDKCEADGIKDPEGGKVPPKPTPVPMATVPPADPSTPVEAPAPSEVRVPDDQSNESLPPTTEGEKPEPVTKYPSEAKDVPKPVNGAPTVEKPGTAIDTDIKIDESLFSSVNEEASTSQPSGVENTTERVVEVINTSTNVEQPALKTQSDSQPKEESVKPAKVEADLPIGKQEKTATVQVDSEGSSASSASTVNFSKVIKLYPNRSLFAKLTSGLW